MMPKGSLVFIIVLAIIQVINGQTIPNVTVQDATVTLREDATINCFYTIYGGTLLSVQWYGSNAAGDEGDLLVSSSFGSNPNGRHSVNTLQDGVATLNIVNTLKSDDRFYQCKIVDSVARSGNNFSSLTVQFIENVMISVKNSTVTEGNDVTIECSVSATPVPTITLYKDEQFITNETTEAFIHKISNVTMSDRGNYRCEAINIVGTRTSPTELLNIQYPPKIVIHGSDNGIKTVPPVEMVVITLEVLANPDDDIKYQWTINPEIEGTVTNSSTLEFKAGGFDTVYNVTVTATNSIGSTTESVMVIVADPCADKPCENGGICVVVEGGYNCSCTKDFSGLNCSKPTTIMPTATEIESTTKDCGCKNGGTCSKDGTCICREGFKGPKCEVSDDDTNVIVIIFGTLGGCVVLVGISFCGHRVYKSKNSKKPPKDPTSDPVVPQGDVEMKQPDSNSDLKRYAASGGHLYTQVSFEDKKKKPDSDNGSNKPTAVDTYMDYVAAGNENRIYQDLQHREEETAYVNAMPRKK